MSASPQAHLLFNETRFERMACGDLSGFFELAEEYFQDVRLRMSEWPGLLEANEYRRLSEDFHRCKGGAALFGFERLYSLFGSLESESEIELESSILDRFVSEVEAAETAIVASRARAANA
jgi:HPt (histidine-containing phosphotransfer) domain-containing protein